MDIGVVLVTFNRLEKLKHSLLCYSNQIFKPRYILVVNNCSTDGTEEFLETWQAVDETIEKIVINLPQNTGGSGGYYAGMQAAIQKDAEWIWVADDDAYPRIDALENMSNYYESLTDDKKAGIAAVCSAVYNNGSVHYGHRNHVSTTALKVTIKKSTPEEYQKPAFQFDMLSYVGACIRKDALIKAGLCRKEYFIYCDDQEHSLRLNKIGTFICVTNSIVDHDSPPFDEKIINWGKYYFKRNDLLMIRENFPIRYFVLRWFKRYWGNASVFSKKDRALKKMYRSAFIDALLNKKGLHRFYRPGWKPENNS